MSCSKGKVKPLYKPCKRRWHSSSIILFSAMLLLFCKIGWGQQTITKFAGTGSIDLYSDWRNIDWTNSANIISDNNSYASVYLAPGESSGYLKSSNYNLNVPTGSTILGIELTIGRYSSNFFFLTRIQDIAVSLIKYNNIVGTNKAVTGTDWPISETAITYGGPTDLWGTTWNSDEINSANFGAILQTHNYSGFGISYTAYVDYMQIKVYYNPPSILFASPNPAVPAANIAKNSTKQPIYFFTAEGVGAGASMSQLSFRVNGTSLANDISSYQVYYSSSSSSLADANSVSNPLTTIPASGSLVTIPIYSPYIGDGTTCYFWICADIKPNATIGNTITVQAVTTSNVTLSTAIDKTGTMYAGGMQTIGSGPTITSFSPTSACSESNTTVTINGTKLNKTTSVTFNGTLSSSISIVNNNQITALLPVSATTGPITVTTDNGSVTSSADFTVNPLPTAVTVSGSGTYCGSTTITASGGTGGTIYYQGTTSGGTSTATASSSETITSSGTYYFRSQSASGCWGSEGSVAVTINPVPTAVTVSGSGTYCGSTTIIASGGTGGTIYYQGTTSGGTSTATASSSQSITTSGTYYFRSQSASGCWGPEGSATVTINTVPTAVTVSGSGTYCGSTTITASGGTGGTIYYQGTTSGGTSTATASSSQSVTTSGTYYFRSQSADGCWGPEGSVTVTINILPSPTFTAHPDPAECQGDDVIYTTEPLMTNYTWSVPGTDGSDYSITLGGIGTGSNTVTLKWLTTGSKTVTVGYTGGNGCTSATPASSTITVNPTPVIGAFN